MPDPDIAQIEFQFGQTIASPAESGYERWQNDRRTALNELARTMGLPLGHEAEVVLRGGAILTGKLALAEDQLWVEAQRNFRLLLRVERCTFAAAEILSCVRLD